MKRTAPSQIRTSLGNLRKSRFIGGVATIAGGTVIAQLITVAATVILSRQYSPADFAVLGLFTAIVAIITGVATLKFELGAVTAKTLPMAAAATGLALVNAAFFSVVALVIGYFFAVPLAPIVNTPDLAPWLWLVGPAVLLTGLQHVMNFWVTRRGLFRNQAAAEIARSLGTAGPQLLFGWAGLAAGGLVVGRLIGLAAAAVVTGVATLRPDRRVIMRGFKPSRLTAAAIHFRKLFFFQTPKAIVNVSTNQLPVVLVAASFGATAAGLYWFVERLLLIPVNLLNNAVQRLFLKTVSERHHDGRQFAIQWIKITGVLLGVGLSGALVVAMLGPAGFGFIFGSKWTEAWYFAIWVSFWFAFRLANAASQPIYIVTDRQGLLFAIESFAAVFRLAIIPVGAYFLTAITAVALYSLAGALLNFTVIVVAGLLAFRHRQEVRIAKGS